MKKDVKEISQTNNGILSFKSTNPANRDKDYILEFRIAVLPTKMNLRKAYNSIADILRTENLSFKILSLEGDSTPESLGWDGSTSKVPANALLDPRGGEISIRVHCDPAIEDGVTLLEKSEEEIKNILLKVWHKLEENNVATGYVFPAEPFKGIKAKGSLVTPFSYRLTTKDPNTKPFDLRSLDLDVDFSEQDLKQHKISVKRLTSLQFERMFYMLEKMKESKSYLINKINAFNTSKPQELNDLLTEFSKVFPSNEADFPEFLKQHKEVLNAIILRVPRQRDGQLSLDDSLAGFVRAWESIETGKLSGVKLLKKYFSELQNKSNIVHGEFITKHYPGIRSIFEANEDFVKLFNEAGYSDISNSVEQYPAEMQILYYNFLNFQKQQMALAPVLESYQNNHESFWAKHKGKILTGLTFGLGFLTAVGGAALTATGVLAPLGIPLTGLSLYALTVGGSAGVVTVFTGLFSAIYYAATKEPAVGVDNRFFEADDQMEITTYGGILNKNKIFKQDEAEQPLLHMRTNNPPKREIIETQTFDVAVEETSYNKGAKSSHDEGAEYELQNSFDQSAPIGIKVQ